MDDHDTRHQQWYRINPILLADVMPAPTHTTSPYPTTSNSQRLPSRPLSDVLCYRCGKYGHYATDCKSSARPELAAQKVLSSPASTSANPPPNVKKPLKPFPTTHFEICRDFNAGRCKSPCPHNAMHLCLQCWNDSHPVTECPDLENTPVANKST
ncbi:hypothetical protein RvY_06567 [Ramazzottius varieornatus]|uniref:CCHC-type domain-containing protein n=1 Tax=Ramazzottius varieornatus TaxID=947166 RepID=A0A1D1V1Y2_RAMVA|nr:hypothetical protein RvY_06567 [Ramazzottius varieornatus]